MLDVWTCADCGSLWAAGAPCCPACRSTVHSEGAPEPPEPSPARNRKTPPPAAAPADPQGA